MLTRARSRPIRSRFRWCQPIRDRARIINSKTGLMYEHPCYRFNAVCKTHRACHGHFQLTLHIEKNSRAVNNNFFISRLLHLFQQAGYRLTAEQLIDANLVNRKCIENRAYCLVLFNVGDILENLKKCGDQFKVLAHCIERSRYFD